MLTRAPANITSWRDTCEPPKTCEMMTAGFNWEHTVGKLTECNAGYLERYTAARDGRVNDRTCFSSANVIGTSCSITCIELPENPLMWFAERGMKHMPAMIS